MDLSWTPYETEGDEGGKKDAKIKNKNTTQTNSRRTATTI